MRTERKLTEYLHKVRHEVVNEFAALGLLLGRIRMGSSPPPEKLKKHEEKMKSLADGLLQDELGPILQLLKDQIPQHRKVVAKRFIRRYGLQPKGNGK